MTMIFKVGAVIQMGPWVLGGRKFADDTHTYLLPGGKPEVGESALDTLCRELFEELSVRVTKTEWFGSYVGASALEKASISMQIYSVLVDRNPRASGEIEEIRWIDCRRLDTNIRIGGALRDYVIPQIVKNILS